MILFVFELHASTISAYLEVVLSEDGVLIDGETPVTVELLSSDGQALWSEDHNTLFFKGRSAFEIGSINKFDTKWFYDAGVQLNLKVNGGQVNLPIYSTPFSFFSHAADIVNSIYMEGVFHMNLEEERIGVNIDHPTPSVRLEVGGAMRVGDGDDETFNQIGMIRWRDNRLEGRHNDAWRLLDVSPADGFESKWTENNSLLEPSFYVLDTFVHVATDQTLATLTVGGDMYIDDSFTIDNSIETDFQLNLLNDYGVTDNGAVFARSVSINATNYLNKDDGLVVSGHLTGAGHGITNITSSTLMVPAIQNNEIADIAITNDLIASYNVTGDKLSDYVVSRTHLMDGFQLSNDRLANAIISDVEIERETISSQNLASGFEFTLNLFEDGAIVSRNIGSQNIDYSKIADAELLTDDYAQPMINRHEIIKVNTIISSNIADDSLLAVDFVSGSLTFDHLDSIIPIDKGGVNQTDYSFINGLLVVSSNQVVSAEHFVLSDVGLGIYVATPSVQLDIHNQIGKDAINVKSTVAEFSGMAIANDVSQWDIGVSDTGDFEIVDSGKSRDLFVMNQSGHIGLRTPPTTEKLTLGGGLMLGDTDSATLDPGTMFFDQDQQLFKLVLDTAITSLDKLPQYNGYYFISNVHNESDGSRVLLAENTSLKGNSHIVSGSFNSTVSGNDGQLSNLFDVQVNGKLNHVSNTLASNINCDQSQISNSQSSVINGRNCFIENTVNSNFNGDNFLVRQVDYSIMTGDNNVWFNGSYTDLTGDGNYLNGVNLSDINGTSHQVSFLNHSMVSGVNNRAFFLRNSILSGDYHVVNHGDSMVVSGVNHYVSFSSESTTVGQDHFIMHGDGVYMDQGHQHIGSGSPNVFGENNILLGHHNNTIDAQNVISIGTGINDITDLDNAIVFHALGGVNILNGDYTVAHLPANGGSWSSVSDQSVKVNITPLNPDEILSKVLSLSILEWNYKGQHYVQHIGPMAQDFYGEFGLGKSEKFIQAVDMDGVILGAIKGLGNYYQNILTRLDQFDVSEKKQQQDTQGIYNDLNQLFEQSNTLLAEDKDLTKQFQTIHQSESDQSRTIDQLNDDIKHMKSMIGAIK